MEKFCKDLPKIELHAHLNGSLSESTIQALCHLKDAPHLYENWQVAINHGEHRTLSECFDMFKAVHALTTCPVAISMATADVLREFEADGVIYLELRSTPRKVPGKMTKEEYVEAILKAFEAHPGHMKVKLLLSIDRRQGPEEAAHTVKMACEAKEHHPSLIAGIDLSGDPTAGAFELFLPSLQAARAAGLGIAVHYAEVPNESETHSIIKFHPDRLGHATCVHPDLGGSQKQWESLLHSKIPIEVCVTSNVRSKTVPSYEKHHFKQLFEAKHPIVLSTDDKGVFCSDLSNEYLLIANTFGLTEEQLYELSAASVDYCLTSQEEKNELRKTFKSCNRS